MLEYASQSLMAISVQPGEIRSCLLEPLRGNYRLVGWVDVIPEDSADLAAGLTLACRRLARSLGRVLWDEKAGQPLLQSSEPAIYPPLAHVVVVANPLPPLRVWLAGLSAGGLAAAVQAVASSSAQTVACYRLGREDTADRLSQELSTLAPDVAIVVGGYDRQAEPAQRPVLALSALLGQALDFLPISNRPHLIFAGNRWAGEQAAMIMRSRDSDIFLERVTNVHPTPYWQRQSGIASALSRHYWTLCRTDPELAVLARWVTSPALVRGIDWSFVQAVRLWMMSHSLPELHGLYCGPNWWLHVWVARGQNGVRMLWVRPYSRPEELANWPAVQLVSGDWPEALWPRPSQHWWDRVGLVPVVMGVGQVNVQAAFQVLTQDVLGH